MASKSQTKLLIKVLTPAQVNLALAEWVAVHAGLELDQMCRVKVEYVFAAGRKDFSQARIELETL